MQIRTTYAVNGVILLSKFLQLYIIKEAGASYHCRGLDVVLDPSTVP